MLKALMLSVVAAGAFAFSSLATPETAEARGCYRGGYGYGYSAGYAAPYAVGYGYRGFAPAAVYVPPRRVAYYGSYGYAPRAYYPPRRSGIQFSIGF